jgi:hypothetical protein
MTGLLGQKEEHGRPQETVGETFPPAKKAGKCIGGVKTSTPHGVMVALTPGLISSHIMHLSHLLSLLIMIFY